MFLSLLFLQSGKKVRLRAQHSAIHAFIAPFQTNQITGFDNDFKMDVIKQ